MQLRQIEQWFMRSWLWAVIVISAASVCGGCGSPQRTLIVRDGAVPDNGEQTSWEEGVRAFQATDYKRAAAIFESLSDGAQNEKLCLKALFALASTRLTMAQTVEEFKEGLALWECGIQRAQGETELVDARFLTPLLEHISSSWAKDVRDLPKPVKPKKSAARPDQPAAKDLAMYKSLFQSKEKELDRLKGKLEAREKEVRRLKHQIDSLEAIHLKFQEKKKEASSP